MYVSKSMDDLMGGNDGPLDNDDEYDNLLCDVFCINDISFASFGRDEKHDPIMINCVDMYLLGNVQRHA